MVGVIKEPRIIMITDSMPVDMLGLIYVYHLTYSSQWSYEAFSFIVPILHIRKLSLRMIL